MNRVEAILDELKRQQQKYPDDNFWVKSHEEKIAFLEWLLEDGGVLPHYEIHERQDSPTVWGMGDVTYHVNLQLNEKPTTYTQAILVFDYKRREESDGA